MGYMASLNPEFALYGSKNECAMTYSVFVPLSQVSTRAVTLLVIVPSPGITILVIVTGIAIQVITTIIAILVIVTIFEILVVVSKIAILMMF